MANTMRWRYGDTCPVMLPVDSATVIEIGDLVYLDADDAKPAVGPGRSGHRSRRISSCFTTCSPAWRCRLRAAATRSRSAWRRPACSSSTA